ncbi:MAG: biotin-dependent carboxyltransferase [Deltaproteobacteria bacterium]|nr:biotin-dependent carboxyltransferase [Deltaproteobacteria bacterium]
MIEVIKPGFFTTVQDNGRWGYQGYGVGVAGAMDNFALSAANLLVGNPEGTAGLEMTVLGPMLKFHTETLLAIAGADLDPYLDGKSIPNWTCHFAPTGSTLSFGGKKKGARAYLAVFGGIDVPPVMGSRSTYLLGNFGGLEGRVLKSRDHLPIPLLVGTLPNLAGRFFPEKSRPPYAKNPTLRVVPGPFADFFSEEGVKAFFSAEYTVTPQSDRMGYRLQGDPIKRKKPEELITCGLANGTVQVPPDGQPIILLADRQTIGGYPIMATLIQADMPLIAQCVPGDKLRFAAVSTDKAREAYLQLWSNLKNICH